jgi:NAD(P)H-hydrate repair Nnr-like enzyme with NAD(P)H-hydrate epimerase domain
MTQWAVLIEETVRRHADYLWLLHDGQKVADRDAGITLASELSLNHEPSALVGEVGRSVFRVNETEWLVVVDGVFGTGGTPGGKVHFRITVAELVGDYAAPQPFGTL